MILARIITAIKNEFRAVKISKLEQMKYETEQTITRLSKDVESNKTELEILQEDLDRIRLNLANELRKREYSS